MLILTYDDGYRESGAHCLDLLWEELGVSGRGLAAISSDLRDAAHAEIDRKDARDQWIRNATYPLGITPEASHAIIDRLPIEEVPAA